MSEQASEGEKGEGRHLCCPEGRTGHFPWEGLVVVRLIQRVLRGALPEWGAEC